MQTLVTVWALTLMLPSAQHPSWPSYMKANYYQCPGPLDTLQKPRTVKIAGKTYQHSGYRMEVQKPDTDGKVSLGVIASVKSVAPETKANLAATLAWFKNANVEWIVADGDLAEEESDLEEILTLLADTKIPVLLVPGNSESKATFMRVWTRVNGVNLVNGMLIRQVVADDVELWTLPGYYDNAFAHQGAVCTYDKSHIDAMLATLRPSGSASLMLVSHGPPLGKGKTALDFISGEKNVGDAELNRLLHTAKIPFGIFAHILEAGGQAVGNDFSTAVAASTPSAALYINAGSLAAEAWAMNDGTTATGIAMMVHINGGSATYEVKRFPQPPP